MATKAKTEEVVQEDGREDIFIPRGQLNDDPMLFVSVNGINYLLPKGETSRVPHAVAYEAKRAFKAQEDLERKMAKMING